MILSPSYTRTTEIIALLAVALLPVSCSPKQSQEASEPVATDARSAQPHTNGLPPDQFLAEFGAMAYTIDAPWSDMGGSVWSASAHKQYESNQINLRLVSNTQSRVDQIALTATVADGAMNPQMNEAFEQAIRLSFTAMDLQIPDSAVAFVREGTTFNTEAGRFSVHLMRMVSKGGNGPYTLSFRMNSQ